jgi:hemerythrin-like domain-containing protein
MTITAIGRGARREAGPLEALLDCHERIRRFTAMAIELCRPEVAAAERAAAAAAVLRYFEEALPRHVEDEEQDLERLLAARAPGAELFGLLGVLGRQHRRLEAELAALTPRWRALAGGASLPADELAALGEAAAALADGFDEHLALEERELLPRARAALGHDDLAALAAAMRQRRGR